MRAIAKARAITAAVVIAAGMVAAGCGAKSKAPGGGTTPTEPGGPPPIIDRELFFGDPLITAAQLSPDGQYLAFIKPYKDVRNIWVKRLDESFDQARPVTADTRPVPGYFWSRDGRYILYVQDKGGNEDFHVYAVDPAAEAAADTGVPAGRDLTPVDGVRAYILSVPRTDPDSIVIGLNARDPAYHDVYRMRVSTGERTLLIENTQKVLAYVFDQEGQVRLAVRQTDDGGQEILRVDGRELVPVHTTNHEEDASPAGFHPDGKRVYIETNKGVNLSQLMLLDPETGKTELVEADPENEVDLGSALFDEHTDELLATIYRGDRERVYPKNEQIRRDLDLLRAKLPEGELRVASATKDMGLWLVNVSSDVDPGSTYLYERASGDVTLLYRTRPELPSEHLAPMKPVRYTARDGLEIPAYLTLPRGVEPKGLPVVINPHGGPWARDFWGYDGYAQFLANRGYAVLQPNFRGSTGYGKKFLNAGNREWGTGAMQHDISDGVKWLVDQGIADPARICIFGGSYGGYATLAGVAYTPELYACGVPYVAPSNLITLLESIPAYWKPIRRIFDVRLGNPEVEADREELRARSPLNFADRIKVPLLVVHGANDPRVKQAEADQIVVALRDKGHAVEYMVAPDEGHGFRAPENRMALAVALERFLAKHLGGRQQEDVPADVAEHLETLMVDVSTVTLPAIQTDPAAKARLEAAMTAPLPEASGKSIKPATLRYAARLQMGPQVMDLTMVRKIEAAKDKARALWRISDAIEMPMGKAMDTFLVDKATLQPVRRTLDGMAKGELQYAPDAITGKVGAMGQSMDVNIPLSAPVLGDGPGLVIAIAGLPLAEGYETTVRQLAMETQKVDAYRLVVTGTETTEVAAGRFETFVVELQPLADTGMTGVLRVMRKAPHHVVKAEYKMAPSAGGGSLATELSATK